MQRSSQAKGISTAGNFAIHAGLLDPIPLATVSVFLLLVAETSLVASGSARFLADRLWDRSNQQVLEITGHQNSFLTSFVASLRIAASLTFLLISILNSVGTNSSNSVSSVILTLASATSFLVDVREILKSEQSGNSNRVTKIL